MIAGLRSRSLSLPLPGDQDHEAAQVPQERRVAGGLLGPVRTAGPAAGTRRRARSASRRARRARRPPRGRAAGTTARCVQRVVAGEDVARRGAGGDARRAAQALGQVAQRPAGCRTRAAGGRRGAPGARAPPPPADGRDVGQHLHAVDQVERRRRQRHVGERALHDAQPARARRRAACRATDPGPTAERAKRRRLAQQQAGAAAGLEDVAARAVVADELQLQLVDQPVVAVVALGLVGLGEPVVVGLRGGAAVVDWNPPILCGRVGLVRSAGFWRRATITNSTPDRPKATHGELQRRATVDVIRRASRRPAARARCRARGCRT